ncbi:hypothetical protein NZL82_19180 [Sphingomonas sanguinis]|uniref:hypothetical protein n=1 Tax=Sphingomonas sp. LC-1 TaxID=3110957 RepID=UPI0021BB4F71|nr:hypothetical protein [Sphingomonas sp. LC-1]MCT8003992.1 hypothetical protein [Sphingomonas sp. LC-1]
MKGLFAAIGAVALCLTGCGSATEEPAPTSTTDAASLTASAAQKPNRDDLLPVDCGMGVCFVSVIRKTELIQEGAASKLFKVMVSGAEVNEDQIPENGDVDTTKISFGDDTFNYVFCSAQLPSVMYNSKEGVQAQVLAFAGSLPHSEYGSAALYTHVCHPGEDWQQEGFAQKHGYARTESATFTLQTPSEVFSKLASNSANGDLKLGSVNDDDWDQLGIGCGCSFSKGKQTILALGAEGVIIRPNGNRRICAPTNSAYESVIQGDGVISCGSTKVEIAGIKNSKSNGDGFDADATLRVQSEGMSTSTTGQLSCSC